MRKPDRAQLPAVAALLLSSDLRLLVRHARASGGWCWLRAERSSDRGGRAAGARHALPRSALQLKTGAGVHDRRGAGVNGRDDLL